jgi:hypothetical protein
MLTETQSKMRADAIAAALEYGFTSTDANDATALRAPLGKFEGEPYYTLYYYDVMMNGCSDETFYNGPHEDATVDADTFELDANDRAAFDLDESIVAVVLWHSDTGFETLEEVTRERYDELLRAYSYEG